MSKLNKILTVISSCKTKEQLASCKIWVNSIKYVESNGHKNYITKMQIETLIIKRQTALIGL